MSADPRFLVTGAHGCIGAWVVHELVADGRPVATFDLSAEPRRLRLLLDEEAVAAVPHVAGDITDLAALERALDENEITNVIHLAALQIPLVRADPPLGARVNVLGTVNVFEAVKRRERIGPVVYASSIAALDAPDGDTASGMSAQPGTLYGVFKRANESTAWVYRQENGISSIGLRPHTVYGVGRDQGLTSAPTQAMLAAAAGVASTIPYGNSAQLQFARDVARAFIGASLAAPEGASVHNLPGRKVSMAEVVDAVVAAAPESAGSIGYENIVLPFAEEADSGSFESVVPGLVETPLADGVAATIERFRSLLAEGLLAPPVPQQAKAV
jgi:nucleoside-diphosphate-sugar epimerase